MTPTVLSGKMNETALTTKNFNTLEPLVKESALKKDKKQLYNLIYSCQYVQNEDNYLKVEKRLNKERERLMSQGATNDIMNHSIDFNNSDLIDHTIRDADLDNKLTSLRGERINKATFRSAAFPQGAMATLGNPNLPKFDKKVKVHLKEQVSSFRNRSGLDSKLSKLTPKYEASEELMRLPES